MRPLGTGPSHPLGNLVPVSTCGKGERRHPVAADAGCVREIERDVCARLLRRDHGLCAERPERALAFGRGCPATSEQSFRKEGTRPGSHLGSDACVDADGGELAMGYAAIYIPEFPTVAWLRLDSAARLSAVAVLEGKAPLERIVSFNRAGRELGLEHGMSKVQADTSGQVHFHTRSIAEENEALDLVFEAAEGFSPRVQIIASPTNGYAKSKQLAAVLLLDQTGTEKLSGDAMSFAKKLRSTLRDLDLRSDPRSRCRAGTCCLGGSFDARGDGAAGLPSR